MVFTRVESRIPKREIKKVASETEKQINRQTDTIASHFVPNNNVAIYYRPMLHSRVESRSPKRRPRKLRNRLR
jgi:hypothetical protein